MSDACISCCRCCTSFIFTSGLTALFIWLSLRTSKPICSVQQIYIPALNKSSNSDSKNTSLYYDIKLDNTNKDKGIYYDALNLTFYYAPNRTSPIANCTLLSFYQGHGKNTRRKGSVSTVGFPPEAGANGSAVFRVSLSTAVRYKIVFWKTKKHRLVVAAEVAVDSTGEKEKKKKGIKMKSAAGELRRYRPQVGSLCTCILFPLLSVLLFINPSMLK